MAQQHHLLDETTTMPVEIRHRYKFDFSGSSEGGSKHPENLDRFGSFPEKRSYFATAKGKLFLMADAKVHTPEFNASQMAIETIQQNYFSYPSEDIAFCLQRAFDIANRKIYQHAQTNSLDRKVGTTCSALVLTDKYAYIAHVGDSRIFRVSFRKTELLTSEHTRVIEMMSRNEDGLVTVGGKPPYKTRTALTRALGVKLGVKVDVAKVPVSRDEYFVLCSDGLKSLDDNDIRNVVLSSSPNHACRRLIDMARARGGTDSATVQIIKIYQEFENQQDQSKQIETYAHVATPPVERSNLIPGVLLFGMIILFGMLYRDSITTKLPEVVEKLNPVTHYMEVNKPAPAVKAPDDLEKGFAFLDEGELSQAQTYFQRVLATDKGNQAALRGIEIIAARHEQTANLYFSKGSWASALSYYKQASFLKPNDRQLKIQIGKCQNKLAVIKSEQRNSQRLALKQQNDEVNGSLISRTPVLGQQEATNWIAPGLDTGVDYKFSGNRVVLYDNLRAKRVFGAGKLGRSEVEVTITPFSNGSTKRFGLIFGHQEEQGRKYQKYYLFTLQLNGEYTVQNNASAGTTFIEANKVKAALKSGEPITVRLKFGNNLAICYVNGISIDMVELDRAAEGGIGFFADPNTHVEFSGLRITPTSID